MSQWLTSEETLGGLARPPVLIYNGVEPPPGDMARASSSRGYFLYVGRIDREKAVDELIELYRASDLTLPLVIVGDGAERKRLEDASLDTRIRFLGRKRREQLAELFAGAAAFVTASPRETFCLPVIEAAALGCPSVGPRSGAMPEVVRDGETGFLFSSPDEFNRSLLRLASMSHAEAEQMASSCIRWAEMFRWERRVQEYLVAFQEVGNRSG